MILFPGERAETVRASADGLTRKFVEFHRRGQLDGAAKLIFAQFILAGLFLWFRS